MKYSWNFSNYKWKFSNFYKIFEFQVKNLEILRISIKILAAQQKMVYYYFFIIFLWKSARCTYTNFNWNLEIQRKNLNFNWNFSKFNCNFRISIENFRISNEIFEIRLSLVTASILGRHFWILIGIGPLSNEIVRILM